MKRGWKNAAAMAVVTAGISLMMAGCQPAAQQKTQEMTPQETTQKETQETIQQETIQQATEETVKETAEEAAEETERKAAVYETNETPETDNTVVKAKNYRLVTEEEYAMVPVLSLFDDGTFGFTYDVLSSYYPHGNYKKQEDKITAVTDDGKYQYVFQVNDDGTLSFVAEESSDTEQIMRQIEYAPEIQDGSVFASEEAATMKGTVKEIYEDSFLVSSKEDDMPGVFQVYFGDLELSDIEEGDMILISWNGIVLETEPGQIYAEEIAEVSP